MKFEFVNKCVTTYQDMRQLLWIFVFLSLVLNGKSDVVEETTVAIHTAYQSTISINESHEEKQNASETMKNNVSSVRYNNQTSLNFTSKILAATYSNTFSSSSTSETFFKHNFTFTTTGYLETLNNNSFNKNEIKNNMFRPSSSLTNNSYNFSEQITPTSLPLETEIQNKDISSDLEFQNENITTPVTSISSENYEITTNVETVTSLIQNTSTQNASRIETGNILNVSSELSKNSSYLSHFSSYDLNEINTTTTEISETNSERDLLNTEVTINSLLKNMKNTENVSEEIINNIPSVLTTTDTITVYTMHMENNTFQETEISSPSLTTLATTNTNHSSENFVEATSVPTMSTSSISTMIISSSIKTNNSSLNSSLENNNVNKEEDPISINQSLITKNDSGSQISTISTQQITVAAQNDKQKEINDFSTIFRNNDFKEEVTTISNTLMLSITPSSTGNLSENSVQKTSSKFPTNENISLNVSYLPSPTVIQDHQQKEFFFKHINNLTDYQRKNMTIDIIFISAVDIVEWFHSYDRVFRTSVASLLTQESESISSINIIYIAPTPLKNEKYFCITFMVESALQKNTYENGVLVVQKIKQNISGLSETLHLPVESIVAGYNETGKCHKSHQLMQEKNWVIIVVLGTILFVAIVVILTMCIQKSRNGKQTWEQDEQEWCATIHGETGRYRSGYQLPINVQNSSNNVVDHFSRVNQKVSLKEQNNSFVSNNGVENVLIHNEEENCSQTTCGECNKMFVEDTKL